MGALALYFSHRIVRKPPARDQEIWAIAANFWMLAVFAFLFGVFYGGWVAIIPSVAMDYFGGRKISSIIGVLYTSVAFGTLIGPSTADFIFDINHSYRLPILASVAANIIAAGIMMLVAKPAAARC